MHITRNPGINTCTTHTYNISVSTTKLMYFILCSTDQLRVDFPCDKPGGVHCKGKAKRRSTKPIREDEEGQPFFEDEVQILVKIIIKAYHILYIILYLIK